MMSSNPMLQQMMDSNPQLRTMMSDPAFLRQLSDPATIQAMMQMQQQMRQGGMGGMGGLGGMGGMGGPFGGMMGSPFAGIPGAGTAASAQPPEERFRVQLERLRDMGFPDQQARGGWGGGFAIRAWRLSCKYLIPCK
jgi:ubiquilin